jgi:hypothetical protein
MQMIHFLHIGKTGGTALVHALKQQEVWQVVIHEHTDTLKKVPIGDGVFFFLRNPITRFVSGFISRQRQGQPRYFFPWSKGEALAFKKFSTPNALAEALSSSNAADRDEAVMAMKSIQHVRDSYWYWLDSPTYLRSRSPDILFIGQQEHLNNDVRVLAKHLKCGPLALPDDDVAAHRNPSHADKSLTETAVANLCTWYRKDFIALHMCREIARNRRFGGSLEITLGINPDARHENLACIS